MSATGEQQSTMGVEKRKVLMEKVDGARIAENDVFANGNNSPRKAICQRS